MNDGGVVAVEWRTEIEVGTAGFNVYRKGEGGRGYERVNGTLVPGQLTGVQGGTYRLRDPWAVLGKKYEYKIEEVEADGDRNEYGPYEVMVSGKGKSPQRQVIGKVGSEGATYSREAREVSTERKARNAEREKEVTVARSARGALMGNQVKIGVKEEGLYYVGTEELAGLLNLSSGTLSRMISLRQVKLKNRGEDVNYMVEGSGLYFYGEKIESIYTDENVYWLSFGSSQRVMNESGGSPEATEGEGQYRAEAKAETNRYAMPAIFEDPEADMWMWEYVYAGDKTLGTRTFPLKTEGVTGEGMATLTVKLKGYTKTGVSGEHHVKVSVNGVEVGEGHWTGMEAYELKANVAQDILKEGENTVEVKGVLDAGVAYSMFYVDALEIEYGRYYRVVNGELEATGGTNGVMTIRGFTNEEVRVLDVTHPKKIAGVTGTRIEKEGTSWRVSLVPEAGAKYLAYTRGAVKTPASMVAVISTTLTSAQNEGEYIVITPRELKGTAQGLADYRAGQGYRTMVVEAESIYDVFNEGIVSPVAIREFLKYAYGSWKVPPEYVVLVGEGSFDYKNYLGNSDCVMPSKMVSTPHGLFESDTYYGDVVGEDGVPEMAVGRLPVMTDEELERLIEKIKGYEGGGSGDWEKQVLLVADNADEGGKFPEDSDRVGQWVPGGYVKQRIYLGERTIGEARQAIQSGINGGASLMNYVGHGALNQLATEGMLKTADVSGLNNGAKLPVVLALTCVVGRYGVPGFDCLGEELLMKEGGGAIGVWAPTGLSMNDAAQQLDGGFFQSRFTDGEQVLGDTVRSALEDYGSIGLEKYMLQIYNLLGDPALQMK